MAGATEARRGSYPKGQARRQQIVDAALAVFAKGGFHSGSIREIAKRAELTPAGLMHHFSSKEELFTEVLRQRDEKVRAAAGEVTEEGLLDQVRKVVAYNQTQRGLTSLYAVVSAEATDPGHPSHPYFVQRYADRATATRQILADAQRDGLVRNDLDVDHAVRLIAAVMDGLQLQWLLDDTLDMTAAFDEFLRGYLHG
jgi:AcrR family transcriptional regulator